MGERDEVSRLPSWSTVRRYGEQLEFYYSLGDRYLGEWRRGLQHGLGTLLSRCQAGPEATIPRTGVYVGGWSGGLQHGQGTASYNNGNKYTGQFVGGFKGGRGVFEVANGDTYRGEFLRGEREGEGIERFHTGERYVGEYRGDVQVGGRCAGGVQCCVQEGRGTAYYSSGAVKYVGQWRGGSPHGNGTYIALNGDR